MGITQKEHCYSHIAGLKIYRIYVSHKELLPLLPDPTVSTNGISRLSSIPSRLSWLVKGEITWLRGKSSFKAYNEKKEAKVQHFEWISLKSQMSLAQTYLDLQGNQPNHCCAEGQWRGEIGTEVEQWEPICHARGSNHTHHLTTHQQKWSKTHKGQEC